MVQYNTIQQHLAIKLNCIVSKEVGLLGGTELELKNFILQGLLNQIKKI